MQPYVCSPTAARRFPQILVTEAAYSLTTRSLGVRLRCRADRTAGTDIWLFCERARPCSSSRDS
jgi:hypothetical protein